MLNAPTATKFLDKVRSDRAALVYLLQGKQNGKPAWVYALIHKASLPIFEHKVSKTQLFMDISQYGEVLYSGWGKEPPECVVNQLKKEYLQ